HLGRPTEALGAPPPRRWAHRQPRRWALRRRGAGRSAAEAAPCRGGRAQLLLGAGLGAPPPPASSASLSFGRPGPPWSGCTPLTGPRPGPGWPLPPGVPDGYAAGACVVPPPALARVGDNRTTPAAPPASADAAAITAMTVRLTGPPRFGYAHGGQVPAWAAD